MSYRSEKTFAQRIEECKKISEKYPDRCPIIIENEKNVKILKHKYLAKRDDTFASLVYAVRKQCKLSPDEALFFFINNELIPLQAMIQTVYSKHKSEDGFLYIRVSAESTFG